ncbi:MAG: hypothetical protein R2865_05100 [Deinococcales bacterium]
MLNRQQPRYPERIIQFGTGNFLRGFVGWQIDLINEQSDFDGGIVALKSTDSRQPSLNEQDGLYTVLLRGLDDEGQVLDAPRLITSLNRQLDIAEDFEGFLALAHDPKMRFIFSNTTEAGIYFEAGDRFEDRLPAVFQQN